MSEERSQFAILHFDASEEKNTFSVELIDFEIHEALSKGFKAVCYFLSTSPSLPFDDIVGRGAAISLHTANAGDRIWAGVCTELELVHSEEHTGTPFGLADFSASALMAEAAAAAGIGGPSYKGRSQYRMTIEADLSRLSLRTNSRIFQGQNAVEIVKTVLKDWNIEIDEKLSKLTEEHPAFDYKVQYQESDLDFVSRILEDAGISYWIQPHIEIPSTQKKKGSDVTKLILRDTPANEPALYDGDKHVIDYLGDGPDKTVGGPPTLWKLSAKQQPKPLRRTIRDRDFRAPLDANIDGTKVTEKDDRAAAKEAQLESFEYQPGAFWFAGGKPDGQHPTPVGDLKHVARTSPDQQAKLPLRRYQAELAGRTLITFRTFVLNIEPSTILQIGSKKEIAYDNNHPHPAFSTDKKLLVIARKITGEQTGSTYTSEITAVYADQPYRPHLSTPKPRILGIQSATVVGPKDQEVYTDEFGRVRVHFPWDRYAKYTEEASCWIRVSQAWAGGSFGFVAHPRIGHEVLVGFFEGDPDQPIIVGTVYSATTPSPFYPATGDNATKTGIRTNSLKGGAGYNELSFQDKAKHEEIHIQAQKDFTIVVNQAQSHDVGTTLGYKVGSSESHDIGQSLTIKVGQTETHEMASTFNVKVGLGGTATEFEMKPNSIKLSSGKASIQIIDGVITIEATEMIHVHAGSTLHVTSQKNIDFDADSMTIDTTNQLQLNCEDPHIDVAKAAPAAGASAPSGPKHGERGAAPKALTYTGTPPVVPGPLEHVNIGQDLEDPNKKKADPAKPTTIDPLAKITDIAKDPTKIAEIVKDPTKAVAAATSGWGTPIHDAEASVAKILGNAKSVIGQAQGAVEAFGNSLKQYIPGPVEDLISSKLGKNFINGAVTKIMQDHGIPTSMNDLAAKGVDKMTKAIGYDGNNKLQKALFGGMVDDFKKDVVGSMGEANTKSVIDNFLGGTSGATTVQDKLKKEAEEAAKKAAEEAAKKTAAAVTTAATTATTTAATTATTTAATTAAAVTTPAATTTTTPALTPPPPVVPPKAGPEE